MEEHTYAMMPYEDYLNYCDTIRERTGYTNKIRSGDMATYLDAVKPIEPIEVDITNFSENGIITEEYEDGSTNTYTFVYDEETDSTTITDSEGDITVVKGLNVAGGSTAEGEKDGFSPIVDITEIEGGHRVSITDVNGIKTFDVMDGVDSEGGEGSLVVSLVGSTDEITPSEVMAAIEEGRPIYITYTDSTYGVLAFTNFSAGVSLNTVFSSFVIEYGGKTLGAFLGGSTTYNMWQFNVMELAKTEDIEEQKTITAVNFSEFESNGKIVETYSDNSTITYNFQLDLDGNPTKITDSNGNETVLIW